MPTLGGSCLCLLTPSPDLRMGRHTPVTSPSSCPHGFSQAITAYFQSELPFIPAPMVPLAVQTCPRWLQGAAVGVQTCGQYKTPLLTCVTLDK